MLIHPLKLLNDYANALKEFKCTKRKDKCAKLPNLQHLPPKFIQNLENSSTHTKTLKMEDLDDLLGHHSPLDARTYDPSQIYALIKEPPSLLA